MNAKWLSVGNRAKQAECLRQLAGLVESGDVLIQSASVGADYRGWTLEVQAVAPPSSKILTDEDES
jgi:hypothetical protein